MKDANWFNELPASMTVCDENGIILEMNQKAAETFSKYGGMEMVGKNLVECHPEPARTKLREMMKSQKANCYTIEKGEIKNSSIRRRGSRNGNYRGLVEITFEIPTEMPHFIRS